MTAVKQETGIFKKIWNGCTQKTRYMNDPGMKNGRSQYFFIGRPRDLHGYFTNR